MDNYGLELSIDDDDHHDSDKRKAHTQTQGYASQISLQHGSHELKRDDGVQTALDVIIESGGTTVGDVVLGSLPSQPTTVSLPGYGALTLGGFAAPSATTTTTTTSSSVTDTSSASFTSSPFRTLSSPTITSSVSSSSGFPTAMMAAVNTTSSSTTAFNALSSGLANSTSISNFTTTTSSFNSTSSTSSFFTTTSFSSTMMTTTTSSTTFSSVTSTTSAAPGPIGGGGIPQSTPSASPTAAPTNDNSGNNNAGPIAGGVVGGVAGALIIGIILFFIARRLKNKANGTRLDDAEEGAGTGPVSRDGPPSGPMTQRSSLVPFAAAFSRMRQSQQSSVYTEPTERGFQRVSGRKLAPVIQSGGDGYADPVSSSPLQPPPPPVTIARNLSTDFTTGSYYRESGGDVFGGTGPENKIPGESLVTPATSAAAASAVATRSTAAPSSTSSLRAAPPTSTRNSELMSSDRAAALRSERFFSSSPDSFDERTAAAAAASATTPFGTPSPEITIQQGPQRTPIVARRPQDGLGRSRPSQDGSRVSRFSETF